MSTHDIYFLWSRGASNEYPQHMFWWSQGEFNGYAQDMSWYRNKKNKMKNIPVGLYNAASTSIQRQYSLERSSFSYSSIKTYVVFTH